MDGSWHTGHVLDFVEIVWQNCPSANVYVSVGATVSLAQGQPTGQLIGQPASQSRFSVSSWLSTTVPDVSREGDEAGNSPCGRRLADVEAQTRPKNPGLRRVKRFNSHACCRRCWDPCQLAGQVFSVVKVAQQVVALTVCQPTVFTGRLVTPSRLSGNGWMTKPHSPEDTPMLSALAGLIQTPDSIIACVRDMTVRARHCATTYFFSFMDTSQRDTVSEADRCLVDNSGRREGDAAVADPQVPGRLLRIGRYLSDPPMATSTHIGPHSDCSECDAH